MESREQRRGRNYSAGIPIAIAIGVAIGLMMGVAVDEAHKR